MDDNLSQYAWLTSQYADKRAKEAKKERVV